MSNQIYLIDTNIIIELEDNHPVNPIFAAFTSLASTYRAQIVIHEAAYDDVNRDINPERRRISLSKLDKFQKISKSVQPIDDILEKKFGPLSNVNDFVDANLLHDLDVGAADFLVSEDRRLHRRARRYSRQLGDRVFFVADAVQHLKVTFEPKPTLIRKIREVPAHSIRRDDPIFEGMEQDYPDFNSWWSKCVREQRNCWILEGSDQTIAGLVVRKDENKTNTDAVQKVGKILKVCTFKVHPESRGLKLGELLLKQILWFAQRNSYDLVYLTTFDQQTSLIDLIEYYGFEHTTNKDRGERIYEKRLSKSPIAADEGSDIFEIDRINYPRFVTAPPVQGFVIPIQESYHDVLYPDLQHELPLFSLFNPSFATNDRSRPGNTIRKVYLCRAPSKLGPPGSLLFFYKGQSRNQPSQAITTIGILEEVTTAQSTTELHRLTGGRSVYTEQQLIRWGATKEKPVKVVNYLLAAYIDPPVEINKLQEWRIFSGHPPQSIIGIGCDSLRTLLSNLDVWFAT